MDVVTLSVSALRCQHKHVCVLCQVESSTGVLQNPLGRTLDGKRVWGGGIVKLKCVSVSSSCRSFAITGFVGTANSCCALLLVGACLVLVCGWMDEWMDAAMFRKHEWIPWPIDLLVKQENDQSSGSASLSSGQQHFDQDADADPTNSGDCVPFTHRVTEMAFGAGLGRIQRIAWGDHVANVHTAAVPPWMVQSEDEYKHCNERQAVPERPKPISSLSRQDVDGAAAGGLQTRRTHQNERRGELTARRGAASGSGPAPPSIGSTVAGDDEKQPRRLEAPTTSAPEPLWLPNFGGVWQEGSRAKTKHEFKRALPAHPTTTTASSALQFRPASVYQRRRQVRAHPSSVTPPELPSPAVVSAAPPTSDLPTPAHTPEQQESRSREQVVNPIVDQHAVHPAASTPAQPTEPLPSKPPVPAKTTPAAATLMVRSNTLRDSCVLEASWSAY